MQQQWVAELTVQVAFTWSDFAREDSSPQETLKIASPLRLRFVATLFSDETRSFWTDYQHSIRVAEAYNKLLEILKRKDESTSPQRQPARSAFTRAAASVEFFGGKGHR
ncbi:TPA: hypothetical protein ACH3X1_008828 [Trebouxia sp. C0004]